MKRSLIVIFLLLFLATAGCYTPQKKEVAPAPKGTVTGRISAEGTDLPLAAAITFPYDASLQGVISDPETGLYKMELPPGIHRLHVEKEGYKWVEAPVEVIEGRTALKDFTLEKKRVAKGILTGRVTSAATGEPIGAMITFPGTDIPPTASSLENGIFKATLPPGTYVVTVSAQGYLSVSSPVVIQQDASVIQNFELKKE